MRKTLIFVKTDNWHQLNIQIRLTFYTQMLCISKYHVLKKKIFAMWYLTNPNMSLFRNLLKFTILWTYTGFELTNHDSGNAIHFSIFLMHFSHPARKSQYQDIFSISLTEKKSFFAASKKRCFERCCSRDQTCQFSASWGTPWRSYFKNLTIDDKFMNKRVRLFIHQTMCQEEKIISS